MNVVNKAVQALLKARHLRAAREARANFPAAVQPTAGAAIARYPAQRLAPYPQPRQRPGAAAHLWLLQTPVAIAGRRVHPA
jgi:hypothetical protein